MFEHAFQTFQVSDRGQGSRNAFLGRAKRLSAEAQQKFSGLVEASFIPPLVEDVLVGRCLVHGLYSLKQLQRSLP